jgi:mRNA-degrading endonuclease toxin of MazEF toxin-antitoxin module
MGSLKRGWVVLAVYPFTDLTATTRRPALVVSASSRPGSDCILAFITSRTATIETTDLLLDPAHPDFAASGLRATSLVRCDKLMTLNHTLLTGRLGVFSPRLMAQVDTRLKLALELS